MRHNLLFGKSLLHLEPPSGYPKPDFRPNNLGHSKAIAITVQINSMNITIETQFENHFPIPVMIIHHYHTEEVNRRVLQIISDLKHEYLTNPEFNEVLTGTVSTFGGYQTPTRSMFLNRMEDAVQILRDQIILPGVACYIKRVFPEQYDLFTIRLFSWANILTNGDWQAPHMHPTDHNLASGVYYVRTPHRPAPEGCIEFLNPHPAGIYHGSTNTRRIQPQSGDLIIFPPYYVHYIYPFKGDEERAIVAFDVIMQTGNFSHANKAIY